MSVIGNGAMTPACSQLSVKVLKPVFFLSLQLQSVKRMLLVASLLILLVVAPSRVVLQSVSTSPADTVRVLRAQDGRVRGFQHNTDADFVLGGLFPLRAVRPGSIQCGEIRLERGIERMEAMLYAVDVINNSTELLPGLKLGYDLRDTCSSDTVGLEESLDILVSGGVLTDALSMDTTCTMSDNSTRVITPIGVVGAASSGVTLPIATLMRLFNMPQVSYASSSSELSNAERFMYFLRTIPPDSLQTAAMVDLLAHFKWTFVSTVHSRDSYGENGIRDFRQHAQNRSICTEFEGEFFRSSDTEDYQQIAKTLYYNTTSNVVIIYCLDFFAHRLIEQVHILLKKNNFNRRFIFIASDGWATSATIPRDFPETVAGYIGFLPFTNKHPGFERYFSSLLPSNNHRNRESFTEFYAHAFPCNDSCLTATTPVTDVEGYSQGKFIPLVIDAIFAYAHAIQNFLDVHCAKPIQWFRYSQSCAGINNTNTTLSTTTLLQYLLNVTFNSSSGPLIDFDAAGDVNAPYRIINFQVEVTENNSIVQQDDISVGTWNPRYPQDQRLNLETSRIQFGLQKGLPNRLRTEPIESNCGKPCTAGQYRQLKPDGCCWECEPCVANNFSSDPKGTRCFTCPKDYWGAKPLTGSTSCVPIPVRKLVSSDPIAIVVVLLSSISLIAVGVVIFIFILNCKHSVVKSSGREQVSLLLIGITLSFCLSYLVIIPSGTAVCFLQRVVIWTSFSLIYGALLVKIVRVARIFLRNPTAPRPRFTQPYFQVIFTLAIVGVQLVITLVSMIVAHPVVTRETRVSDAGSRMTPVYVVTCTTINPIVFVAHILYDAALILLCTFFGWRTRHFPENFNEAKYVLSTSLALILIWLGFIPTYIATQNSSEYRYAALNFPILLSSLAVLIIFFVPKIYFIYGRRTESNHEVTKGNNSTFLTDGMNLSRYMGKRRTGTSSTGGHSSGVHTGEMSPGQGTMQIEVGDSIADPAAKKASPLTLSTKVADCSEKGADTNTV